MGRGPAAADPLWIRGCLAGAGAVLRAPASRGLCADGEPVTLPGGLTCASLLPQVWRPGQTPWSSCAGQLLRPRRQRPLGTQSLPAGGVLPRTWPGTVVFLVTEGKQDRAGGLGCQGQRRGPPPSPSAGRRGFSWAASPPCSDGGSEGFQLSPLALLTPLADRARGRRVRPFHTENVAVAIRAAEPPKHPPAGPAGPACRAPCLLS